MKGKIVAPLEDWSIKQNLKIVSIGMLITTYFTVILSHFSLSADVETSL